MAVEETNAIGTAYLRIDVLPFDAQPELREKLRRYADARLAFYRKLAAVDEAKGELARAAALQHEVWALAVVACQRVTSPAVTTLVLSALNNMIDMTTTRTVALESHPPAIIFVMLGALVLTCALLAGHAMAAAGRRHWLHSITFAVMMTIIIYVILDIEYPRMGLISVESVDRVLIELRQSMN